MNDDLKSRLKENGILHKEIAHILGHDDVYMCKLLAKPLTKRKQLEIDMAIQMLTEQKKV